MDDPVRRARTIRRALSSQVGVISELMKVEGVDGLLLEAEGMRRRILAELTKAIDDASADPAGCDTPSGP